MSRLSKDAFLSGTRCLRLGDIVYLPQVQVPFERLRPHLPRILGDDYAHYRMSHGGREPKWVRRLTGDLKAYFRSAYVRSDGFEPFALMPHRPFLNIGYGIEEDGLVHRTVNAFQLSRLQFVRQLGFLHDPVIRDSGFAEAGATPFAHTRFRHVLDVMAVATLIAHNNGLSWHARNMLRIAALSHDALTPAGGDTVKLIDPPAFDEDKHYPELFSREGWPALKERYRLSEKKLHEVILGKGVLGRFLDLADKIAYVAQDASAYFMEFKPPEYASQSGHSDEVWLSEGYAAVEHLLGAKSSVCALWDAVEVCGGDVVVNDPDRLADFLRLRALLFENLYYHPAARFTEHVVARIVIGHLYRTGVLTRDALLQMIDRELEVRIEAFTGIPIETTRSGSYPSVETFSTREQAERREFGILSESGDAVTLIEEFHGGTNAGLHLLVRDGTRVKSFREARRGEAEAIEEIITSTEPFRLYSFSAGNPAFTPEFRRLLAEYQESRRRACRESALRVRE